VTLGTQPDRRKTVRKYPPIVREIAAIAFCDNGAQITLDDIAEALDADISCGYVDPTPDEATLLICGDDSGTPPPLLCAAHPALDALLLAEMT